MSSDETAGHAAIKKQFIKCVTIPEAQTTDRTPVNCSVKRKRKQEKLVVKTNGPTKLCPYLITPFPSPPSDASVASCPYLEKGCRYSHDLDAALSEKPPDLSGICPLLKNIGHCRAGLFCRWASSHSEMDSACLKPVEVAKWYRNSLTQEVQNLLYKKIYNFDRADRCTEASINGTIPTSNADDSSVMIKKPNKNGSENSPRIGLVSDEEQIKLNSREKKQVDFSNKLYLAPLTTVGNLPFRRVCKRLGADITCGEMAVATQLLQGRQSEWALLRRHESEDIFGVQLCGAHVDSMTRAAQLIDEQCQVDFVDINCGCPLDMIWKKGAGSGLLQHGSRLESIVRSVDNVLSSAQVTVKMRAGVRANRNTAHQLIPGLKSTQVSLITVHGRSREQRYTKLADWDYVKQCAELAYPIPVFGNGDILSLEDYMTHKEASGVSGIMIARGALIKPWIFTEIREERTWDISSTERLDILKDFTNYGLELWGSDIRGVETTRRFMLEWLSFLYRYIPYGLLERPPQRINERPPAYFGRNDLETWMASENCADWIRISEMLLGPVPDGFTFTPKHKANAYR